MVLKPNWISRAIRCVMDDPQVCQAGGQLAHRELPRIWAADEQGQPYPLALYPVFLRLMERFDLCYQLEPQRPGLPATHSLVPLLLPEPPRVSSEGLERVEMRYTLGFVPTGLMSWLLVCTHRYSQQFHWREGALLQKESPSDRMREKNSKGPIMTEPHPFKWRHFQTELAPFWWSRKT